MLLIGDIPTLVYLFMSSGEYMSIMDFLEKIDKSLYNCESIYYIIQ